MTISFLNLAILAGLAALAIPPIIHFLNRRRHDVVDWGAMQFLLVSTAKRRRFMIDEYLLMALRMGLIALLVLAFARPEIGGPVIAGWTRPPRDTVLLVDPSYSMERSDNSSASPWKQTRDWLDEWLKDFHAGDRAAILLAGTSSQSVVAELTSDQSALQEALEQLPRPTGNADWPRAVDEAWNLLRDYGQAPRRDIVILTDRQKLGWADPATLAQWHSLKRCFEAERTERKDEANFVGPSIWAVTFAPEKAGANLRMSPLQTSRTVVGAGQRLRFATALHWSDLDDKRPPKKIQVTIDQEIRSLPMPSRLEAATGRLPLTFDHRFTEVGVHRVSVIVDPNESQDVLLADNRQDVAIEVVQELPVLLIDGGKPGTADSSTYFLEKAFSDPADKAKVSFVVPRVVTHAEFDSEAMLTKATMRPRAVVLADVPRLSEPQLAGLTRFVEEGGGLLIFLGPRCEQAFFNERLYHAGKGLLPARLDGIEQVKTDRAVSLDVKRFLHSALDLFRDEPSCTLGQATYTRWWKAIVESDGRGATGACFVNDDPWLIEKAFGQGRVLLSTLPMDQGWDGHLPKTWEFPVLAHELLFALADVRSGGLNLTPGQALRMQGAHALPAPISLFRPNGKASTRVATAWPFLWESPGLPGVYEVKIGDGPRLPVIVHADPRESDLTPSSEEERRQVAELLPLRYVENASLTDTAAGDGSKQDAWWLFLIGVIALLCGELWLTRRMAIGQGRN